MATDGALVSGGCSQSREMSICVLLILSQRCHIDHTVEYVVGAVVTGDDHIPSLRALMNENSKGYIKHPVFFYSYLLVDN